MSKIFYALETMFTSSTVSWVDFDGDTFDNEVLLSFSFGIGVDRPSTSSSRDINAFGFGGGPS
jgi:hypothetical protein